MALDGSLQNCVRRSRVTCIDQVVWLSQVVRQTETWVVDLGEFVPCGNDTGDHVVESALCHSAVVDGLHQCAVFPINRVGHGKVETRLGTGNAAVLGVPVRHHKALEGKFLLEQAVHHLAILAGI
ncbi:hypothetical protein OGATHE_003244 [Ogataea polymorpha]|uniref:Uncharacterized protein n=1 Tax=Ogataea polymorpha TaxID=460523 RepID=A0A9P8P9P5_9ASCO|nr:hypothetical protein OGATHE_003244 [Ogataea polymorpha]